MEDRDSKKIEEHNCNEHVLHDGRGRFRRRLVAAGARLGNAAIALLAVGVPLFLLGLLPPALVREGYVRECRRAGTDYLGNPIWQGRFVGADGRIIRFTIDRRTRWLCYRRSYYGGGSTADYRGNTSIRYQHTWGGEWYAIHKLSSESELLAGHGRNRARIRIYYRPLAPRGTNWVDDFEQAGDRQPRSGLSIRWMPKKLGQAQILHHPHQASLRVE